MKLHSILIASSFFWGSCDGGPGQSRDIDPIRETIGAPLQDPNALVVTYEQPDHPGLTQKIELPKGTLHSDLFKQQEVLPPVIDILVVIDNSGSMEEEQANLSDKLSFLIADLNEVDWQINVITTDSECKRIEELPLLPDTPDMEQLFEEAVKAGTSGNGREVALEKTLRNIKGECSSEDRWLRDGTNLAVLIVSDEDESVWNRPDAYAAQFIEDVKVQGYMPKANFKVYGLIEHPTEPCPTAETSGEIYSRVIRATDGLWGSICDADYSETLAAISQDIRLNLKVDFPLTYGPIRSTIKLMLDGVAYTGDWTVIENRLILAESLPEGSTLTVSYQIESMRTLNLGVSSEDFKLSELWIGGELIDPSNYVYDLSANTILLGFDPAPGSLVETKLVSAKALKNEYDFPEDDVKVINCFVEKKKLNSKVTVQRKRVTFNPPIPPGKRAVCLYEM